MQKILIDPCDVLIIDQIGKEISGSGMDPNVSGATSCTPYVSGGLVAQRRVILSLSKETHGTAVGMGAAGGPRQREVRQTRGHRGAVSGGLHNCVQR